jgi:ribosomal protein S18 acetylase RimI-like enzyme
VTQRPTGRRVRPYRPDDERWATEFLDRELGGRLQARRGEVVDVLGPGLGFVAQAGDRPIGLATWRLDDGRAELSAIATSERGSGVGSSLVRAVCDAASAAGARSVWLVTANDNLDALGFYQRRGFRLVALRPGAIDEARRTLKATIPATGQNGIPIRDELELEWRPDE